MKHANMGIQIQTAGDAVVKTLEIKLNGVTLPLQMSGLDSTWTAEQTLEGPVDFALTASGCGMLFLRLTCGKQVVLKKKIPLADPPIAMELKNIPLLI